MENTNDVWGYLTSQKDEPAIALSLLRMKVNNWSRERTLADMAENMLVQLREMNESQQRFIQTLNLVQQKLEAIVK